MPTARALRSPQTRSTPQIEGRFRERKTRSRDQGSEGRRVAEQVIYHPGSRAINVLTRSDEDTMLVFDKQGGVKEVTIEQQRRVLTDALVRGLARAALQISESLADAIKTSSGSIIAASSTSSSRGLTLKELKVKRAF